MHFKFFLTFRACVKLLIALTIVLRWAEWCVYVWKILCLIFVHFLLSWRRFCGINNVCLRFLGTIRLLSVWPKFRVFCCFCKVAPCIPLGLEVFCCSQNCHEGIGTLRWWMPRLTARVGSMRVLFVEAICPTVALGNCHLLLQLLPWNEFWTFVLLFPPDSVGVCWELQVELCNSFYFGFEFCWHLAV